MKEISLVEMEAVSGGSAAKVVGCTFSSILLLGAFVTLFTLTAGASAIAIAVAATGVSLGPASWALSCFTDY